MLAALPTNQPYSKWYTDPELVREITDGFETLRTADSFDDYESSYTYSWDDIRAIQDYIATNGIGETKHQGQFDDFIPRWLHGHETTADLTFENDGEAFREREEAAQAERERANGIYVMGSPAWARTDPWQQGKYVRYPEKADGSLDLDHPISLTL